MLFLLPVAVLGYQLYDKRQKEKLASSARRQEADHGRQDLPGTCKDDESESEEDSSSAAEGDFHLPGESNDEPQHHRPLQGDINHIPSNNKTNDGKAPSLDQRHLQSFGKPLASRNNLEA